MSDVSNARRLARYPILAVGLAGAAFSAIKTGRDTVFFSEGGLAELPLAYLWSEIGLALGAYIHLSAMKRWGSRRTRVGAFLFAAALFMIFSPFTEPDRRAVVQALFPVVPTVFAALFATAWLLAGDLLEGAPERELHRAYGLIGASAMVGGILGGLSARGMSSSLPPPALVTYGALLLLAGGWVCARGHAAAPIHKLPPLNTVDDNASIGRDALALLKLPFTRALLLISALASLAAMYVEFQFYSAAFQTGHANAAFFANYYVVLSGASLLLQLIAAPWIQSKYGLSRALLILPVAVMGGAGAVAMTGTVVSQTVLRVLETSLKNSIHRSSWEQMFLRFDRERRAAIKVMIDGTVPRAAGVIGAIALQVLLWMGQGDRAASIASWTAWTILPIAGMWMWVTRAITHEKPSSEGIACDIRIPDS